VIDSFTGGDRWGTETTLPRFQEQYHQAASAQLELPDSILALSSDKVELKKRRNPLPRRTLRRYPQKKLNFHHYIEGQVASALGLTMDSIHQLTAFLMPNILCEHLKAATGGYPRL